MTKKKLIPVLITTDNTKRGVFFGYIDPADADKETLRAEEVQMCVYWSTDVKGVLGLAATGPSKSSRVTRPGAAGTIRGVTLVVEATSAAEKAWKACPWG